MSTIVGGPGPDSLPGTASADFIDGLEGNDTLDGGSGNDTIEGRAGDDSILGNADNDTLNGGTGNDMLIGGAGRDYLIGAEGDDTLNGGTDSDVIGYFQASAGIVANLQTGIVTGAGTGTDVLLGIERIVASEHDDSLTGSTSGDEMYGFAGDDTITGGDGNDTIQGGAGDDSLQGGAGAGDYLYVFDETAAVVVNLAAGTASGATIGVDTIGGFENVFGSPHADSITGDAGPNTITGYDGNDTLDGGADGDLMLGEGGADSLRGGAGNDVMSGGAGNDTLDGGDGMDRAYYIDAPGAVTINLITGIATGAWGTDTLIGIEFGQGSDFGDDMLIGGPTTEFLSGNAGNDTLIGGSGAEYLRGGHGNDTITGGGGNDTIDGANDTMVGNGGIDTAVFSGLLSQYTITLGAVEGSYTVSGPDGVDSLISIEVLQFADGIFEVEDGTEEPDEIEGDDGADIIRARGGDDRVRGGGGDDAIFGEGGDDELEGDDGDDFLDGGEGNDRMEGGEGNDTYVVDSDEDEVVEPDSIFASQPGGPGAGPGIGGGFDRVIADKDYALGNAIEQLTLAAGSGARMGVGNALPNPLDGNEFDNTLTGAGANDTLEGGAGIDTAVFSGSRAQYAVTLGDTVSVSTSANTDGTDTLTNMERLRFADIGVAIDLDGNAGSVARVLGAVFGQAAVSNEVYAGIGLSLADGGMSYEALMGLALGVVLGPAPANAQVVTLLYRNVVGTDPDAGTRDFFTGLIEQGLHTQASLAALAGNVMGIPQAASGGLEYI